MSAGGDFDNCQLTAESNNRTWVPCPYPVKSASQVKPPFEDIMDEKLVQNAVKHAYEISVSRQRLP